MISYFPNKGSVYIVSDENTILSDNSLQEELKNRKFNVCFYEDPIVFRYMYETTLRCRDETNRATTIIVISNYQFNQIPYDIFSNADCITLSLELIFPKFSNSIVQQLPTKLYPMIFEVHSHCSSLLSSDDTADFILKEVFSIDIRHLTDDIAVVKAALQYFERFSEPLPRTLVNFLKGKLTSVPSDTFECFISKESLSRLLNKHWKFYVKSFSSHLLVEESETNFKDYFNDSYIRKNIKAYIKPVEVLADTIYEKWMMPGLIFIDIQKEFIKNEKDLLFQKTYETYDRVEWIEFASKLGSLQAKLLKTDQLDVSFKKQVTHANGAFEKWMYLKYQELSTLPLLPNPKILHQVPWYLERKFNRKIALIVMDGMSYTQWNQIKEVLSKDSWLLDENGIFSWVPTITPVARQAIFSGMVPREYASSINTTNKEGKLWRKFWMDHGFQARNIAYQKSLGLKEFQNNDFEFVNSPFINVYGAVIDVIDKFMHGAKQGNRTMASELDNWLDTKYLQSFLELLFSEGFDIYLTSDHGNVESIGRGRISQGVTVDSANQRIRIYQSDNIRDNTAKEHPDTLIWDNVNLPDGYHVLLAKNNEAFVPKSERIVTHGGIHIEEVIVPFVKIYR